VRRYASAGSIYLLTEISCGAMSRYPAECTVVHCSTASVMKDMLRIKSRQAEISGFSSSDVDFILECLCVSLLWRVFFCIPFISLILLCRPTFVRFSSAL